MQSVLKRVRQHYSLTSFYNKFKGVTKRSQPPLLHFTSTSLYSTNATNPYSYVLRGLHPPQHACNYHKSFQEAWFAIGPSDLLGLFSRIPLPLQKKAVVYMLDNMLLTAANE
jgi:hypothetical protein